MRGKCYDLYITSRGLGYMRGKCYDLYITSRERARVILVDVKNE